MSNYRVGETADLFDPTTGAWVGVLDRNGKEQEVATSAAVAAALGIAFDAKGDLILNIVPRTGTLASLLALDGGAGEIASATDAPALVKLTGNAGEAVALMPFGTVRVQSITAVSFVFPALTIKPDARIVTINPTNVGSGTATIAAGTFIGQPLRVMMLTGGGGGTLTGLPVDGSTTSISSNQALDLVWTGTAWHLENQTTFAGNGLGAFGLFLGVATGAGAIAIGQNAQAAGAKSLAVGPVTAAGIGEVAIAAGTKASRRMIGLQGATTTAASTELTADGAAATAANRYKPAASGSVAAVARIKVTVSGKDTAGNNVCQFVREAVILSDGITATLVNSPTPPADVVSGITGTPGATLGVNGPNLTVSVVGSTQSIHWAALVESVEQVVS